MSQDLSDPARWSPIPPARTRRKKYEVLRAQANAVVKGVCLHQDIVPVLTHWHPSANGKVRHRDTGCHWCEFFGEKDIRWYGFMPAWSDLLGKVIVLEVTHQAALDCHALSKKRVPLRGRTMSLHRCGNSGHNRGGCVVSTDETTKYLPPPVDVEEFLESIFEKAESVPAIAGAPRYREAVQP